MGMEPERFRWEDPFMYKHKQTCNIPTDQIYRPPSQLFYNVNTCLFFSDKIAWLFSKQPRDSQSQTHCKDKSWQGFWLRVNWLLVVSFISSASEGAMSKALLPVAKKGVFHLSSNGFLNKRQWFIQPYCAFIHLIHLGHLISEPTAAIVQAVTLWTQGEESSSELLVSDLMARKTHLQHRKHHASTETGMNAFSGEKIERPRDRPLKKMRPGETQV